RSQTHIAPSACTLYYTQRYVIPIASFVLYRIICASLGLEGRGIGSSTVISRDARLARIKVVLTVDTEASIAGAFRENAAHTPLIHEPVAGVVDGKSEALGFLVDTLSRHGLVATFFVETVQARYFPDAAMGGYVDRLLRAGQDVQLHLHPCWLSFEDGKLNRSSLVTDDCAKLEPGQLAALIGEGADRIG